MGRRGNGDGTIDKLPSGKYRARRAKIIGGELVRESKTFSRRAEAQDWLRQNTEPAKSGTVAQWLDTWLELIKSEVAAKTYKANASPVKHTLKPKIGDVKLKELTSVAISRMLSKLAEERMSQSERHRVGRVLRQALRSAVEHGQIPKSPMSGVKVPAPKHPEKRAMTREELATFLECADRNGRGYQFRLWADTGLRPGEFLALKWSDIDLERGAVSVKWNLEELSNTLKELKTKASRRVIRLAKSTVESCVVARPLDADIFAPDSHGGHFWASGWSKVFRAIRKECGLDWVTPYTIRHTMATLLIQAGVPLKVVSERLGHESITTTLATYIHVMPNDQERAAVAMDGILPPVGHAVVTAEPIGG